MRNINELYSIYGRRGIFTKEYIENHNIPYAGIFHIGENGYAYPLIQRASSNKIMITQADGSKKAGFMYGERQWSYSAVERDEYRAAQNGERDYKAERKRLLARITNHYEKFSNEELLNIAEMMEREG